jgi:2-oxoglutarate ferredoxin oxidoreductase subunit delta
MSMKLSVHVDQERCKGCSLCVSVCARGLIRLSSRLNDHGHPFAEIDEEEKCGGCMNCAVICPEAAVEIAHATAAESPRTVPTAASVSPLSNDEWTAWDAPSSANRRTRTRRESLATEKT